MVSRSPIRLSAVALLLFGFTVAKPVAVDAKVSSLVAEDVTGSVLALVGDLVPDRGAPGGGLGNADAVHDLMVSHNPAAYLHLGDLQYECGDLANFLENYDFIWGDKLNDIYPAIGTMRIATVPTQTPKATSPTSVLGPGPRAPVTTPSTCCCQRAVTGMLSS